MAILIDPPFWPSHDTLWSHMVSDTSHDELHAFAAVLTLPRRSFDLDHYDVPEQQYARAVNAGAVPVSGKDLVRSLRTSGLRLRQQDRERARPQARRAYLTAEWDRLGNTLLIADIAHWRRLGGDLLTRWSEPHRHYHDVEHLEDVLLALDHLGTMGEVIDPVTLLAAWFHDAVYTGRANADEHASADFAVQSLVTFGLSSPILQGVHAHIVATIPAAELSNASDARSAGVAHLLDADLSIFGASPARYRRYAERVRAEYAHVPDTAFREGRSHILSRYLARPRIFRTAAAHTLWELTARHNLTHEIELLA